MGSAFSQAERARLEAEVEAAKAERAALQAKVDALLAEQSHTSQASTNLLLTKSIVPAGSQALLGGALGSAAGYSMRVIGRIAAFGVGATFVTLQSLSYLGYITINWRKVERDATARLDRDGDGELTANDLKEVWNDVQEVLTFNLPAGAGFTAGLLWGLGLEMNKAGGAAAVASLGARWALLPRVVAGGATATGLPAVIVEAKRQLDVAPE